MNMREEMLKNEITKVKEENAQMKEVNQQLKERMDKVVDRMNILEEKEQFNRDVLDSNVVKIYENMRKRANLNGLLFYVILFIVMLCMVVYLEGNNYDDSTVFIILIFDIMALAGLSIYLIKVFMDTMGEVITFIKNKEWKK